MTDRASAYPPVVDELLPAACHVRPLITTLRNPTVQALIAKLGGYDLEPAGIVEPLTDTSAT